MMFNWTEVVNTVKGYVFGIGGLGKLLLFYLSTNFSGQSKEKTLMCPVSDIVIFVAVISSFEHDIMSMMSKPPL